MKANPKDRVNPEPEGRRFPWPHVLAALGIAAVVLWFSFSGSSDPQETPSPAPIAAVEIVTPEPLPAPDIPEPTPPAPVVPTEQTELVVIPAPPPLTLEASDEAVREQLAVIATQEQLAKLLLSDNLIQRSTSAINGLSRGQLVKKLLPLDHPGAKFSVIKDADAMYLDPAGYRRYNPYVKALVSVDSTVLVDTFHRFRPLFEQAYGELGLEPTRFDNAVMATLDLILASEELDAPIALQRKSVMYTYADPRLEKLPPLQKQMLRMGPENTRLIKAYARELRAALLAPQ